MLKNQTSMSKFKGEIKSVRQFKNKNTGKRSIRFTLRGSKTPVILTQKQVEGATGIKDPHALIGHKLKGAFYKANEKLLNGGVARADGIIVKSYEFEDSILQKQARAVSAVHGFVMFAPTLGASSDDDDEDDFEDDSSDEDSDEEESEEESESEEEPEEQPKPTKKRASRAKKPKPGSEPTE
mgnify:CR=1 FL=1